LFEAGITSNQTPLATTKSIDSLDSNCSISKKDNFKAKEFFNKENTTRMNIGHQKLLTWAAKMRDNHKN